MQRFKLTAMSVGVVVIAAVVAVWLAGRGPDPAGAEDTGATAPNVVRPGAPGASSSRLGTDPGQVETIAPTKADVDFVEGMIHHHQQALVMADYVPSRGSGASLKVLARRLRIGQDSEIKLMQQWLEANRGSVPGVPTSSGHAGHGEHTQLMPGMLTAAELARMEAARGTAFDKLFLQGMIKHHQGALTMIGQLYAAGGGAQSELDKLVRDIDSDQTIEITRMRQLLRTT
jgi:uncharacterized protein (DUF305 family)